MLNLRRILPGLEWRTNFDQRVELKGIVIKVSPLKVWVETESRHHKLVCLLGDNYLYVCRRCQCSVYHQEIEAMRAADIAKIEALPLLDRTMMTVRPPQCPFCTGPIYRVEEGDKLKLHYRFMPDGSWGAWWGERVEW